MTGSSSAPILASVDYDPFADAPLQRVVAVTEPQREVWLADKLSPDASLAYNESVSVAFHGRVDVAALQASVQDLVDRHESLRATLSPEGDELCIAEHLHIDTPVLDLTGHAPADRARVLKEHLDAAVSTPFALEVGPLIRAEIVRLAADDTVLVLTAHHIVCDGWSFGVLLSDMATLYAQRVGTAVPALEPAASYADYAVAQGTLAQSAEHASDEAFWLSRYVSGVPTLDLPTDRPRPRLRTTTAGRVDHEIDAALLADLRKFGAKQGASLFATLFTGFATLMRRLSGQTDVVVGIAAAGQSVEGWNSLVGHCVNILPVRGDALEADGFDALLKKTQSELLDAFDHQQFTFGTLLKKLAIGRDPSRLPLVSVLFNLDQRINENAVRFPGLRFEMTANARRFENFEIFLNAVPLAQGLRFEAQYNSDLYDEQSVRRWLDALETMLRAAVQAPSTAWPALAWVSPQEHAAMDALQPAPHAYDVSQLIHDRFMGHARSTPERVALVFGSGEISYAELDRRSNAVAHALVKRGVGSGSLVGLCLLREPDLYASVLGVLKAGAAFVPLDPAYPKDRLNFMVQDAGIRCVVSKTDLLGRVDAPRDHVLALDTDLDATAWAQTQAVAPLQPAGPRSPAYVIYTSGSTGKPKGVVVPHQSLLNLLVSMAREPGLGPDDRLVAVTTMSFDMSIPELFLPLAVGARVIVASRDDARDGESLRRLLETTGATLMQATPSGWRVLLDSGWRGHRNFKALAGGEAVPQDLAQSLLERCGEVWNMYGPTETTVWSTCARLLTFERGVSIGTPMNNTSVWILDVAGKPCPRGVSGEIWIGGDGVTLGYLNRPELTAERFIADPFSAKDGARLYRTGDRGRWRNDGTLEHLGRLDFQVKVRGYRIELGEIENTLTTHPGVDRAIVITREDRPGDVRLAGYVVARGTPPSAEELRDHLRLTLPGYMVPQHILFIPAVPLTPNGKIDRKALPVPDASSAAASADRVPPRTETEAIVLAAMEEVLSLPGLSIRDDFFAVGGHSLLAARLTSRLNKQLQVNLPLRTLFESSTTEQLAGAIEALRGTDVSAELRIQRQPDQTVAPLTVMQERIRFMEELHPGRVVYNTPSAHRLTGPLDAAAFERAMLALMARQPSLRTSIEKTNAGPVQRVHAAVAWTLPQHDLSAVPAAERETDLMRRMQAIIDTPIDIAAAPLFHAALYKLGAEEHVFLFVPHHIVWDGWSFDLLYAEMSALYPAQLAGQPDALPPLPISYVDFAHWHGQWMGGTEFGKQLGYWKQRLKNVDMPAALPTDHQRQAGMTGSGAVEWVHVDKALTEQLRVVARQFDATLNMLSMAVFAALMNQTLGGGPLVMGIPVRGRLASEAEPVMGFFNNLLPAHLVLNLDQPLAACVAWVKREMLDLFANQEVPFERLAEEPEIAALAKKSGLYQALFSFQDARERPRNWGPLRHESVLVMQKGATEDFGLWLMEVPGGLEGGVNYNADLFDRGTAALFRDRFIGLLQRVAANPQVTVRELVQAGGPDRDRLLAWLAAPKDVAVPAAAPALRPVPAPQGLGGAEAALADLWARLLGIDAAQIGPKDNFFDLGGSSLLVMQAVAESARLWQLQVEPSRYVYESLGQLAVGVPSADAAAATADDPVVAALAAIWADLLGVSTADIGADDNFFDLGGNSLLAMRFVAAAQPVLGKPIDAQRLVYENLRQLASDAAPAGASAPAVAAPAAATAEAQGSGLMSKVGRLFGRRS